MDELCREKTTFKAYNLLTYEDRFFSYNYLKIKLKTWLPVLFVSLVGRRRLLIQDIVMHFL